MKIIYRSQLPKPRPYRGKCRKCGSVVEASRSELYPVFVGRYPQAVHQCVTCPICAHFIGMEPLGSIRFWLRRLFTGPSHK